MKVLVVDDSRSVRAALTKTLQSKGYDVIEADDGRHAVAQAAQHKPDLVTLDVNMPEMDGFEACEEIRKTEHGRTLPIIFITANDTLEDRARGFLLGASEFISKSVTALWDEVAIVVDRILQQTTILREATVLVLEKNDRVRMILRSCLEQQGTHVVEANSAEQAIDFASRIKAEIDMVIVNGQYFSSGGSNLLSEIRGRAGLYHIPIIVLSEKEDQGRVLEFFQAGATDHMIKPFTKEELLARVGVHLRARNLVKIMGHSILELERLSKLRDEFVAISSHDLKSPLSGISSFAQLLDMQPNLDEKGKKYVSLILQSSNFMMEEINDIVELCRNETVADDTDFEPVNISTVASFSIDSLQATGAAKGVDVELLDIFPGQPIVSGTYNKLLRIFNNLLSNAIKFTDNGGKVSVIIGSEDDYTVQVKIKDSGIGIPESMLPSLFEKFTKASRKGTAGELGTGLGMSITKQLVDLHGGSIYVESAESEGTTFRILFPLAKG